MRSLAPPHLLLAAYCGGLCLALAWRPSLALLVVAGLLAAAGLILGQRAPVLPGRAALLAERRALVVAVALMLLFAVAGVAVGGARLAAIGRSTLAAYTGHHVPLTAVLTDLPAEKDGAGDPRGPGDERGRRRGPRARAPAPASRGRADARAISPRGRSPRARCCGCPR